MSEIYVKVKLDDSVEEDLGIIDFDPCNGFYFRNPISRKQLEKKLQHIKLLLVFQKTPPFHNFCFYAFSEINRQKNVPKEGIYIQCDDNQKTMFFMVQHDYHSPLCEKYGPEVIITLSYFSGFPKYSKENLETVIKKVFTGLKKILFFEYGIAQFVGRDLFTLTPVQ